jgi:PIN domain nuclease of toxin-antitoxin system
VRAGRNLGRGSARTSGGRRAPCCPATRPPAIDPAARSAIADPTNDVLVSAASIWKIEIKRALGKLVAPNGLVAALEDAGFDVLPITGPDAERAGSLPAHHRDPFDRMLVAQADRLGALVVSRDRTFQVYGTDVLGA